MKKILLPCFDFFREESTCLSKEIFDKLTENPVEGVVPILLPVSWEKIDGAVKDLLNYEADAVLFLGNGRGSHYRLEKIGMNVQGDNIRDNFDQKCQGDEIDKRGVAAYFSTWDLPRLQQEMNKRSLPCIMSYFPGVFLCNGAYYRALREETKRVKKRAIALLHLTFEREARDDLKLILDAAQASLEKEI